jgi:hypothetical protein
MSSKVALRPADLVVTVGSTSEEEEEGGKEEANGSVSIPPVLAGSLFAPQSTTA